MNPQKRRDFILIVIAGIIFIFTTFNPQFTLTINGIEALNGIELRMNYILNIIVTSLMLSVLLRRAGILGLVSTIILIIVLIFQLYSSGFKILYV